MSRGLSLIVEIPPSPPPPQPPVSEPTPALPPVSEPTPALPPISEPVPTPPPGSEPAPAQPPVSEPAPTPPTLPLQVSKLQMRVSFARAGQDSYRLVAGFSPPAGLDPQDMEVKVTVGGVERRFTLDERGRGRSEQGSCVLRLGGGATMTANCGGGDWSDNWATLGLNNENLQALPITVPVTITLGEHVYSGSANVLYSARAGKWGRTR